MTNNEAINGKAQLLEWNPGLTVDLIPDTTGNGGQFHTNAQLRVNHSSYAGAVILAEAYEVAQWIAGSPVLAHEDPAPARVYLYENAGRGAGVVYGVGSDIVAVGKLDAYVAKVERTRGRWVSLAGDSEFAHMGNALRLTRHAATAIDAGDVQKPSPRFRRALAESIAMAARFDAGEDIHNA